MSNFLGNNMFVCFDTINCSPVTTFVVGDNFKVGETEGVCIRSINGFNKKILETTELSVPSTTLKSYILKLDRFEIGDVSDNFVLNNNFLDRNNCILHANFWEVLKQRSNRIDDYKFILAFVCNEDNVLDLISAYRSNPKSGWDIDIERIFSFKNIPLLEPTIFILGNK